MKVQRPNASAHYKKITKYKKVKIDSDDINNDLTTTPFFQDNLGKLVPERQNHSRF